LSDKLIEILVHTGLQWREPDYPPRVQAVTATLARENRFTEEAVAFAVNQQMSLLEAGKLRAWRGNEGAARTRRVGVIGAGNIPMADLQDVLGVILTGHNLLFAPSGKSPFLTKAFLKEVAESHGDLGLEITSHQEILEHAEALIASGSDETIGEIKTAAEAAGIAGSRLLLRGNRYAVAVLDGLESADEREGLAEDTLLHEGLGCRNVALIWAPTGTAPDSYLESFAHFRSVFPAHPSTPGALRMQQAFLAAVGQPHAQDEDLSFLISKGEPEVQGPAHVRWSEYTDISEVSRWLDEHRNEIQLVVTAERNRKYLPGGFPYGQPGHAQRPPLDWRADGTDMMAFLRRL
jgi:hypothetical protein